MSMKIDKYEKTGKDKYRIYREKSLTAAICYCQGFPVFCHVLLLSQRGMKLLSRIETRA